MNTADRIRFAVIGLNHGHIYGLVDAVTRGGGALGSFFAPEPELSAAFSRQYPDAKLARDERQILEDPSIRLVVSAGIPDERAPLGIRAMEHGKDAMVRGDGGTGYLRVDWFSPAGLPAWGDTRLTVLGTEGYIEVRKNVDLGGRSGANHLFIADARGVRHVDCSAVELPYGRQLVDDVLNRTETAMSQAHAFLAAELAIAAQTRASTPAAG